MSDLATGDGLSEGDRHKPTAGLGWWIARRVLATVIILALASMLVFAATQALPGDPARLVLGPGASQDQVDALRQRLHLDEPLVTQYRSWVSGVVRGDLGTTIVSQQPVGPLIADRAKASAIIVLLTALVAIPISFLLGSLAAIRRDRLFDKTILGTSLVLTAIPEFVIGLVLVIVFATTIWRVLPAVAIIPPDESPLRYPRELVLMVATLVLAVFPYLSRLVRASMIDALQSEYVQMARLKGLPPRLILRRHAFPNAIVPALQGTAGTLAYLCGGIVVVEYLFGYPGLGSALAEAISTQDLPVVQASVLVFAAAYLVFNLLADLATILLTPRLRTRQR